MGNSANQIKLEMNGMSGIGSIIDALNSRLDWEEDIGIVTYFQSHLRRDSLPFTITG